MNASELDAAPQILKDAAIVGALRGVAWDVTPHDADYPHDVMPIHDRPRTALHRDLDQPGDGWTYLRSSFPRLSRFPRLPLRAGVSLRARIVLGTNELGDEEPYACWETIAASDGYNNPVAFQPQSGSVSLWFDGAPVCLHVDAEALRAASDNGDENP